MKEIFFKMILLSNRKGPRKNLTNTFGGIRMFPKNCNLLNGYREILICK